MSVSWGDLQDARVGTLKYKDEQGVWREAVPVGTPGPKGTPGDVGPVGPSGPDGLPGGPVPVGGQPREHVVKTAAEDFAVAWTGRLHNGAILQNGGMRGPWNTVDPGNAGGAGTSRWTVTLEARRYLVVFGATAYGTVTGARDIRLEDTAKSGLTVGYARLWIGAISIHRMFGPHTAVLDAVAGSHTFSFHNGGSVGADGNDYGCIVLYSLPLGT